MLFIEALRTHDEIEAIAAEYRDTPLLYNWVEGGKSPSLPYSELAELGFSLVIMPITVLLAAVGAMRSALDGVKAAGTPIDVEDNLPSFGDFTDLIGLSEITELQGRYI